MMRLLPKLWARQPESSLILLGLALCFPANASAQLHGNYTVGGGSPDYPTLTAALTSLQLIGCNEPVTFLLRSGDYSSEIINVNGLEPYYPLLVRSETGQAEDVIVTLSVLYECSDISFQYLTVYPKQGGDSNWAYKGFDLAFCHRITVDNCIIQGLPMDDYRNGISVAKGDSHTFTNNQFHDLDNALCYSSVELAGSTSNRHYGPQLIRNNSFDSCDVAIRIMGIIYTDSVDIAYNHLNNCGTGVYLDGSDEEVTRTYVHHNTMYGMYDRGIRSYYAHGYDALPIRVFNNMISGGYSSGISTWGQNGNFHTSVSTGIDLRESEYFEVYNNSLFGGIALTEASFITLRNNILRSDTTLLFYMSSTVQNVTSDHNDLYRGDGGFAMISSEWYTDLDAFRDATGLEANSVSVDPGYVDPLSDLHAAHPLIQFAAIPMPLAVDDIDGDVRNADHPDIGADEFNAADLPPLAWFEHDCPQDLTVQFTDMSVHPGSYSWDFGDVSPADTSADPIHSFPAAGAYEVTLIVTNTLGADTFLFTVSIPVLEVPTFIGGLLSIPPIYLSYQWSVDGTPIAGADSNVYVPATDGSYSVTYTDSLGCAWTTADLELFMGLSDDPTLKWALYPMPASEDLNLRSGTPIEGQQEIIVRDALGRLCLHMAGRSLFPVDVRMLAPGTYTLRLSLGDDPSRAFRFIIQDHR